MVVCRLSFCTKDHALSTDFCFFFYCYGHPRDLHSFPTRRSSDLNCHNQRLVDTVHLLLGPAVDGVEVVDRWTKDRKSTRLNSSHVKISYAVFCLKKKNITQ